LKGVIDLDRTGRLSIVETLKRPKSLFNFYDNQVLDIAANFSPSARGEIEITEMPSDYLPREYLEAVTLHRIPQPSLGSGSRMSLRTPQFRPRTDGFVSAMKLVSSWLSCRKL
jgi:dTDP-glucose pyrophosphorylase